MLETHQQNSVTSVVLAGKQGISTGCGPDRSDRTGDKLSSLARVCQKSGALGALSFWFGKQGITTCFGLEQRAKAGARLNFLARRERRSTGEKYHLIAEFEAEAENAQKMLSFSVIHRGTMRRSGRGGQFRKSFSRGKLPAMKKTPESKTGEGFRADFLLHNPGDTRIFF